MEPSELLRKLTAELERLEIPYFVTGSVATITYGEPRFTNDIDVVVDLQPQHIDAICSAFPAPEFYCSRDAVAEAIKRQFQFNILHPRSGLKVDVIVAADTEFNRLRFQRRQRAPGGADFDVWMSSPEDVIIKKMQYFQEGESEKHIRDILGVLKVHGDKVDRAYVALWADRLQLTDTWHDILERAEKG